MRLIRQFKHFNNAFHIKAFTADSAFISKELRGNFRRTYPKSQLISQFKFNQMAVITGKKNVRLDVYFNAKATITKVLKFRCGNENIIF